MCLMAKFTGTLRLPSLLTLPLNQVFTLSLSNPFKLYGVHTPRLRLIPLVIYMICNNIEQIIFKFAQIFQFPMIIIFLTFQIQEKNLRNSFFKRNRSKFNL